MKKFKKILIYTSSSFLEKKETKDVIKYLSRKCSFLEVYSLGLKNDTPNKIKYDLVLSIGGDGVFIAASKYAYKKTIPVLCLNFGRL